MTRGQTAERQRVTGVELRRRSRDSLFLQDGCQWWYSALVTAPVVSRYISSFIFMDRFAPVEWFNNDGEYYDVRGGGGTRRKVKQKRWGKKKWRENTERRHRGEDCWFRRNTGRHRTYVWIVRGETHRAPCVSFFFFFFFFLVTLSPCQPLCSNCNAMRLREICPAGVWRENVRIKRFPKRPLCEGA